jgi:hypothetical protein
MHLTGMNRQLAEAFPEGWAIRNNLGSDGGAGHGAAERRIPMFAIPLLVATVSILVQAHFLNAPSSRAADPVAAPEAEVIGEYAEGCASPAGCDRSPTADEVTAE